MKNLIVAIVRKKIKFYKNKKIFFFFINSFFNEIKKARLEDNLKKKKKKLYLNNKIANNKKFKKKKKNDYNRGYETNGYLCNTLGTAKRSSFAQVSTCILSSVYNKVYKISINDRLSSMPCSY